MRISALSDEDLRREMREHTAAIPAARRMFGLNASERGAKGGEQLRAVCRISVRIVRLKMPTALTT